MSKTLLEIQQLCKTFAVPVLRDMDFTLHHGEVHALMGSNGAGKSTLSNIIAGVLPATSGSLWLEGATHSPTSVKQAEIAGVRMVMQELNLFPTLSVAENICFKSLGKGFALINHAHLRERARTALARVGLGDLDPDTPVSALGVGQQQLVEIAAALAHECKLLILDEPTAALTDPQITQLFTQIRALREKGVGILYISHRMDEICRIADRVSVLRDGRLVATRAATDIDVESMVALMAGEALNTRAPQSAIRDKATAKPVCLKLKDFSRGTRFRDINLEIRAGEILGIGGLIGSGRSELLRAVFGADRADSGALYFTGDDVTQAKRMRSPHDAITHGIGMVVEDRKAEGLLLDKSLQDNIGLATLALHRNAWGVVDTDAQHNAVQKSVQALAIKCDNLAQAVNTLSGGNQQKALIARWLLRDLPILLFDEPTRGVDAQAKHGIHELLRELAAQGKAVVFVSSESAELLALADRVVVMSNGRLAGDFDAADLDEERLLDAAFRYYNRAAKTATRH